MSVTCDPTSDLVHLYLLGTSRREEMTIFRPAPQIFDRFECLAGLRPSLSGFLQNLGMRRYGFLLTTLLRNRAIKISQGRSMILRREALAFGLKQIRPRHLGTSLRLSQFTLQAPLLLEFLRQRRRRLRLAQFPQEQETLQPKTEPLHSSAPFKPAAIASPETTSSIPCRR